MRQWKWDQSKCGLISGIQIAGAFHCVPVFNRKEPCILGNLRNSGEPWNRRYCVYAKISSKGNQLSREEIHKGTVQNRELETTVYMRTKSKIENGAKN